jgi:hypothetical protein
MSGNGCEVCGWLTSCVWLARTGRIVASVFVCGIPHLYLGLSKLSHVGMHTFLHMNSNSVYRDPVISCCME